MKKFILQCLLLTTGLFSVPGSFAYDPSETLVTGHELPKEIANVGIDEKLGAELDLSIPFISDTGAEVALGEFFNKGKPVLLSIVYFECPTLCNYHLNGVNAALKEIDFTAGQDFEVVAVSMDPRETSELAAEKKAAYVEEYGKPNSSSGWHFLTGSEENIKKLADQVGFRFAWNEKDQQYAHASAAYAVSPSGTVSRYLHGIEFKPDTMRLALLEAGQGKIGNIVDQIMSFCFQFNPAKSEYTVAAWNVMRLGAVMMVIGLAIFLIPAWLRERTGRNRIS